MGVILLPEQFAKPLCQSISQNLFDRPVRYVTVGLFAASRRLAKQHPVGRAVASSAESLRVHERLKKINRMPVHALPISGDAPRHAAQDMRCQVLDPDPRQDQEPGVVSDEADIATSRFRAPADVAVAATQVTRS